MSARLSSRGWLLGEIGKGRGKGEEERKVSRQGITNGNLEEKTGRKLN